MIKVGDHFTWNIEEPRSVCKITRISNIIHYTYVSIPEMYSQGMIGEEFQSGKDSLTDSAEFLPLYNSPLYLAMEDSDD